MPDDVISLSRLSNNVLSICAASQEPLVHTAPEWISGYFDLEQSLPKEYGWRFSSEEAIKKQVGGIRSSIEINRIYWTDQARNTEAYSLMTMWRGSDLMKSAIRSINVGELITSAVLSRSLLELSAAYLTNANVIENLIRGLAFPANTVVVSQDFEARVVKMIWGTRLGTPEPYLQQTNILSVLQKLSKNPKAADLMPHYEFLCEVAHPNVIGNARFWSHVERVNDDGSETRVMSFTASTDQAAEIASKVIWSLAWSAGSLRNGFVLVHDAVQGLLAKLKGRD